jgi:uncharacterized protein (TIGR03086 family)
MSEIADRYRRLSSDVAATIAAVPEKRWASPSPCPEWTARDVVQHFVDTQGLFLGFIGESVEGGPSVTDDPAGAWDHARGTVQTILDDPARATVEFQGFTGTSTFEAGVDKFLCTDLVVHRWDLATATGQTVALDPADMARARTTMEAMGDLLRSPGAMGPELDPGPGADEQTAFLAFFGRRA